MKGISNRKEIYDQIPNLAAGKIDFIPVFSAKVMIGNIFCNRVEYGEYEVGFRLAANYTQDEYRKNHSSIDDLLCRISKILDTKYYKPFRLETKEVRDFWFSRPKL